MTKYTTSDLPDFDDDKQYQDDMRRQGDCHFARELYNTWSRGIKIDIGPIEVFDYQWINKDSYQVNGKITEMIQNGNKNESMKQDLLNSDSNNVQTGNTLSQPGSTLMASSSSLSDNQNNETTTTGLDLNEGQPQQPEGAGEGIKIVGNTNFSNNNDSSRDVGALPYKIHQDTPGGANK